MLIKAAAVPRGKAGDFGLVCGNRQKRAAGPQRAAFEVRRRWFVQEHEGALKIVRSGPRPSSQSFRLVQNDAGI
jgi:hypothetical protein